MHYGEDITAFTSHVSQIVSAQKLTREWDAIEKNLERTGKVTPSCDSKSTDHSDRPRSFAIGHVHALATTILVVVIAGLYAFVNGTDGFASSLYGMFSTSAARSDNRVLAAAVVWIIASALTVALVRFWSAYVHYRSRKLPLEVARRVLAAYPPEVFNVTLPEILLATSTQSLPRPTTAPKEFRQKQRFCSYWVYRYDTSLDWSPGESPSLVIEVPVRYKRRTFIDVFVRDAGKLVRPSRLALKDGGVVMSSINDEVCQLSRGEKCFDVSIVVSAALLMILALSKRFRGPAA